MKYMDLVRSKQPLVICLTNDVVKNFTANGLIAVGASPAMSAHADDLKDLLRYAGALLINIGTADERSEALYHAAMTIANEYGVPAVLDPVACGASAFRKRIALELLEQHTFAVLRGNASEVASLIGETVQSKGVDSQASEDVAAIAQAAAKTYGLTVAVTGETDAVSNGKEVCLLHNGSAMMPKVVGTGCLLGAVVAAYVGVAADDTYEACAEALGMYAVAGELAAEAPLGHRPGHYAVHFIDALYTVTDEAVRQRLYKEVQA